MFNSFHEGLKWYLSTAMRFFVAMPRSSVIVVAVSLVEKISFLLSFLLPIKVILLLGSPTTPNYFPESLRAIERDQLIVALSIASFVFYMLNIGAKKISVHYVSKCSQFLSDKSKKLVIFQSQQAQASWAFGGFMKAITGIVFLMLALVVIKIIYPNLLFVMVAYLIVAPVLVAIFYGISPCFQHKFNDRQTRQATLVSVASVGFFIAFVFIVSDFLLPINPPTLIFAIIGLILTKQALANVASSVANVIGQYESRSKVEALFFHGHAVNDTADKHEVSFWSLLEPEKRNEWIKMVLDDVLGLKAEDAEISWRQTGVDNLAAFIVTLQNENHLNGKKVLIKVFNHRASNKAENDIKLFKACGSLPVLPEFLGESQIDHFRCQVFKWPNAVTDSNNYKDKFLFERALLAYELPKGICDQYARSHPFIWQRLNPVLFHRLRVMANGDQLHQLYEVEKHFEEIKDTLMKLPMCLGFSNVTADSFVHTEDDTVKLLSWGGWNIEPLGYGWSFEVGDTVSIANALENLKGERKDLDEVAGSSLVLSVMMSAFESSYTKKNYNKALEILPLINECLADCRGGG